MKQRLKFPSQPFSSYLSFNHSSFVHDVINKIATRNTNTNDCWLVRPPPACMLMNAHTTFNVYVPSSGHVWDADVRTRVTHRLDNITFIVFLSFCCIFWSSSLVCFCLNSCSVCACSLLHHQTKPPPHLEGQLLRQNQNSFMGKKGWKSNFFVVRTCVRMYDCEWM